MRRHLIATTAMALALAAIVQPASADDFYKSGYWTAYFMTAKENKLGNVALCGMRTGSPSASAIYIKSFAGSPGLTLDIFKNDWRIPEGQKVTVNVGFDKEQVGTADAVGGMLTGKGFQFGQLAVRLGPDDVGDFMSNFMEANKMWVAFPNGTEKTWFADMTGSREVAKAFMNCIARMPVPTQPFGQPEASQPFGKQPSQPFSNSGDANKFGTDKFEPDRPAKKSDI